MNEIDAILKEEERKAKQKKIQLSSELSLTIQKIRRVLTLQAKYTSFVKLYFCLKHYNDLVSTYILKD